ncbi:MAG: FtsW/RodA/SpoVE family cell cycle protein [Flavobacteriales bacterium]|jgi:cell division protein FtsW|nr:FtsW/RodA/SpoVE family cell cycle protein [Flavobacteriales bacterium]
MNNIFSKYLTGDKVIWVITILLSLFSLLIVYSSTSQLSYKFRGGNTEAYILKHALILGAGFLIMVYVHKFKINYFSRLSQIGIVVSVILLLLVLLLPSEKDAQRWLFGFQPSDIAKISLIVYLARQLSVYKDQLKSFKVIAIKIMLPIALICGLILPADLSTALMLFAISMVLVFISSVSLTHIGAILGSAIIGFCLLLLLGTALPNLLPRVSTWKSRIAAFAGGDEAENAADKNYQTDIAKAGIANGGLQGTGPSKSRVKNLLPSAWADFIFAIFIEEYGSILGGLTLILLYLIILYRVIIIAINSKSDFGSYLAFGLGFSIVFQAFLNMGVSVNLLPVTGQPLPMISMGGTSILFTSIAFALILSVSKDVFNDKNLANES